MLHLDPLTVVIVLGAFADWIFTAILIGAAWQPPRIGPLTERAVRSVLLSIAVTIFAVLSFGDSNGLFDDAQVRGFGALAVVLVAGYPIVALAWYWRTYRNG